jgi:phosphodiesterase/alkaline phosphatase D-like protein
MTNSSTWPAVRMPTRPYDARRQAAQVVQETFGGRSDELEVLATEWMVIATRIGPGVPTQVDAWDGYGYEHKQILDHILDNNVQNVVPFTRDIHAFFAGMAKFYDFIHRGDCLIEFGPTEACAS